MRKLSYNNSMIDEDNFGLRSNDGGFISESQYAEYIKSARREELDEPLALLEIHLNYRHIYEGKQDDPCVCPLALAIKDALDCSECEVWRDQIIIDSQVYPTTGEMKTFIDYFDRYGCVDTAAKFLRKRPEDVFRISIKRSQFEVKKHQVMEQDLPWTEVLQLEGIDPSETPDDEEQSDRLHDI